jgi:anti-sigma-K factor RskA
MTDFNEERDLRAAEYVLGVLDEETRATIRAELTKDPLLAEAVAAWERRLAPLSLDVTIAAPPASLWSRVAASLETGENTSIIALPPPLAADMMAAAVRFWRNTALAAMALAAGLAAVLIFHPAFNLAPSRNASYEASIVSSQGSPPCWLARADSNGRIVLTALCQTVNPPDKDLELWAVAGSSAKPVPLGILSGSGRYVTPDAGLPLNHLSLLVSLESKGGSLNGRLNGPVLYGGQLSPLE